MVPGAPSSVTSMYSVQLMTLTSSAPSPSPRPRTPPRLAGCCRRLRRRSERWRAPPLRALQATGDATADEELASIDRLLLHLRAEAPVAPASPVPSSTSSSASSAPAIVASTSSKSVPVAPMIAVRPGSTKGASDVQDSVIRLPASVSSVASSGSIATVISVTRSEVDDQTGLRALVR